MSRPGAGFQAKRRRTASGRRRQENSPRIARKLASGRSLGMVAGLVSGREGIEASYFRSFCFNRNDHAKFFRSEGRSVGAWCQAPIQEIEPILTEVGLAVS